MKSGAACPGLIEATGCQRICAFKSLKSGAACPGLIEAFRTRNLTELKTRNPGQPAPASLKRAFRGKRNSVKKTYDQKSGAACPGLIEATTAGIQATCISGGNPGQPAPASLKRRPAERNKTMMKLKSGAACPGLIEAVAGYRHTRIAGREIRGSLPRPH